MFSDLHQLALQTPFNLMVTAEGELLTLTVMPRKNPKTADDDISRAALSLPLQLTGTPVELEAEFTTLLMNYRSSRASLAEQLAATDAVLKQAKDDAAAKAKTPQARPKSIRTLVNKRPGAAQVDLGVDEGEETGDGDDATPTTATTSTPAADVKPDDFSLF